MTLPWCGTTPTVSLDTSFSGDGMALLISAWDDGYGVAVQSDGKIVVAGDSSGMYAVVRYLGDAPANAEITVLGDGRFDRGRRHNSEHGGWDGLWVGEPVRGRDQPGVHGSQ